MKRNQPGFLLILFLLSAAGICTLLALSNPQKRSNFLGTSASLPSAYSPQVEQRVNQHLFFTSQKQDWAQKKMQAENVFMAPEVGTAILPSRKEKLATVDHSADQYENNAFNDLNRYPKTINPNDPENTIQGQLQDQDKQNAYDETYRREFARRFVENARLHGYRVKLNEDLVVISVTPIVQSTYQVPPSLEQRHPSSVQAH